MKQESTYENAAWQVKHLRLIVTMVANKMSEDVFGKNIAAI